MDSVIGVCALPYQIDTFPYTLKPDTMVATRRRY